MGRSPTHRTIPRTGIPSNAETGGIRGLWERLGFSPHEVDAQPGVGLGEELVDLGCQPEMFEAEDVHHQEIANRHVVGASDPPTAAKRLSTQPSQNASFPTPFGATTPTPEMTTLRIS